MSVYLDASVLVPLFVNDTFSDRAESLLQAASANFVVSDFLRAEFASVIARMVRVGQVTSDEAPRAFTRLDTWAGAQDLAETTTQDIRLSEIWLRRLDLNLRAPDAVHIAIASRLGASLATFDVRMAGAAQALGVAVEVA